MNLFADTETSGFVDFKKEASDPSQPKIVQLAMVLEAPSGRVVGACAVLIKPSLWKAGPITIGEDVVAVHGITTEMAEQYGVPPDHALDLFLDFFGKAQQLVAHNLSFDWKAIRASFHAEGRVPPDKIGEFCTMHKSTKTVNLPPTDKMMAAGMNRAKSPNLGEAYEFFTGQKLAGGHDALADVYACRRIFKKLTADGADLQEGAAPAAARQSYQAPAARPKATRRQDDKAW